MAEICGQAYNVFLHLVISLPDEERRKQVQILWDTLNSDVLGCGPPSKKRKADECFSHKRYVLKTERKNCGVTYELEGFSQSESPSTSVVVVD